MKKIKKINVITLICRYISDLLMCICVEASELVWLWSAWNDAGFSVQRA